MRELAADQPHGFERGIVCQRISGACNADDTEPQIALNQIAHPLHRFSGIQDHAGDARSRLVGAIVLPQPVPALDIAGRRYRQVNAPVLPWASFEKQG